MHYLSKYLLFQAISHYFKVCNIFIIYSEYIDCGEIQEIFPSDGSTLFIKIFTIFNCLEVHDSHSLGATNSQKFESPFGFDKFLPDLAYVVEISEIMFVCTWIIRSTKCSEWFTVKGLANLFSYDLFGLQIEHFFTVSFFLAQMSMAFAMYHSCVKEGFVKKRIECRCFPPQGQLY